MIIVPDLSLKKVASAIFSRFDDNTSISSSIPNQQKNMCKEFDLFAYEDLERFAVKAKSSYPDVISSHVVCEILDTSPAFRITQLMLDNDGNAIKDDTQKGVVGRIVVASRLDGKMHSAIKGVLPADFTFRVA